MVNVDKIFFTENQLMHCTPSPLPSPPPPPSPTQILGFTSLMTRPVNVALGSVAVDWVHNDVYFVERQVGSSTSRVCGGDAACVYTVCLHVKQPACMYMYVWLQIHIEEIFILASLASFAQLLPPCSPT